MKKQTLFAALAILAVLFASCKKVDYNAFVGTWGVEKIEYYNIDYAGNPIAASFESYNYDPEDVDNTIQLVFNEDKTGEMRDSAVDTLWIENQETGEYDTYIYCPDTTLVYPFTFSYDEGESALYMTIKYSYPYDYTRTFLMKVSDLTHDSFIYENEYRLSYVEKAYLKRLSDSPTKTAGRKAMPHPQKRDSFLGGR